MQSLKLANLLFILLFVIACGSSESESNASTSNQPAKAKQAESKPAQKKQNFTKKYYTSTKYGFKIQRPDNWEMRENHMENVPVVFINRPQGTTSGGTENITVAVERKVNNNSLEDYYNYSRKQILASGQISSILEESKGRTASGLEYKTMMFDRPSQQGPMISISYLFFNKRGHVITCMAPNAKFNTMKPFFEEVGTSIIFN